MINKGQKLFRLLQLFEKHQVKYMIIGGLAINRYGFNRTTGDVDFYLQEVTDNREKLVDALEKAGYGRFEPLLTTPSLPVIVKF